MPIFYESILSYTLYYIFTDICIDNNLLIYSYLYCFSMYICVKVTI